MWVDGDLRQRKPVIIRTRLGRSPGFKTVDTRGLCYTSSYNSLGDLR